MSDQQIRDEVITMLVGGFESTAETLAWTFYLLALHPEEEARLHDEVDRVLVGRLPTIADLPRLPFTSMVLQESMRLYPAAIGILRHRLLTADEVKGYPIPMGSLVFLNPWCTHRHPAYWDKPDTFYPEHFSPERCANRSRYAFIPFGGGPRQCIGNTFATIEAQLVLATIAQRYSLQLTPHTHVVPQAVGTLRPQGLLMTVFPRTNA